VIPIHLFSWCNSPIRLDHLIVEVSRSNPIGHTKHTHTHTLLYASDQLRADGAVYRRKTKQERDVTTSKGFEKQS